MNESAEDRIRELEERVAALTAGADPTPVPEAAWMTPGQLLHRLNEATVEERLSMAERIIAAMGETSTCFRMDHKGHIEEIQGYWHRDRALAEWLIREARWIAAYPEEFLAQRKAGIR